MAWKRSRVRIPSGPVSYTHLDVYKRQEFGLLHTTKTSLAVDLGTGGILSLKLGSVEEIADANFILTEALKVLPNADRLRFIESFGTLCGVEIPVTPPPDRAPLNWDELRELAAAGVEIGCHLSLIHI